MRDDQSAAGQMASYVDDGGSRQLGKIERKAEGKLVESLTSPKRPSNCLASLSETVL
jgi:hypothetical protein